MNPNNNNQNRGFRLPTTVTPGMHYNAVPPMTQQQQPQFPYGTHQPQITTPPPTVRANLPLGTDMNQQHVSTANIQQQQQQQPSVPASWAIGINEQVEDEDDDLPPVIITKPSKNKTTLDKKTSLVHLKHSNHNSMNMSIETIVLDDFDNKGKMRRHDNQASDDYELQDSQLRKGGLLTDDDDLVTSNLAIEIDESRSPAITMRNRRKSTLQTTDQSNSVVLPENEGATTIRNAGSVDTDGEGADMLDPKVIELSKKDSNLMARNAEWASRVSKKAFDVAKAEFEVESAACMRPKIRELTAEFNEMSKSGSYLKQGLLRLQKWWQGKRVQKYTVAINPMTRTVTAIEKGFGTGVSAFYDFFITIIYMNLGIFFCSFFLLILPWLLRSRDTWPHMADWNILLGLIGVRSDILGKSWFFFGGYEQYVKLGPVNYSFAFFYPFVIILYFFLCMIVVVYNIGHRLKRVSNFDHNMRYVNVAFNMWDHSLTSVSAVSELRRAVATKLSEYLVYDANKLLKQQAKTKKEWALLILRRTIGIALSVALIIGAPVAVIFITQYYDTINSIFAPTTSILTAVINVLFPQMLRLMVKLENYQDALIINYNIIGRTYVVKMATTIALLVRVLNLKDSSLRDNTCRSNEAALTFWQMILIDFLVCSVSDILINTILYQIGRIRANNAQKGEEKENRVRFKLEFDTSGYVISLLYRQTIIWIGTIMSPMIPLLGTITNFIMFYVHYVIMSMTCKFPDNPVANAKSSPFNHVFLLLTMFLCLIPAFAFMLMKADIRCGPYIYAASNLNITMSDHQSSLATNGTQLMYSSNTTAYPEYIWQNATSIASPFEIMARAWSNNPVFSSNSQVTQAWSDVTEYMFHPLTLFVIATVMVIASHFLNQRRKMYIQMWKNAEEKAAMERKEKIILLQETGFKF